MSTRVEFELDEATLEQSEEEGKAYGNQDLEGKTGQEILKYFEIGKRMISMNIL